MTEGPRQSFFSDHKTIGWMVSILLHIALVLIVLFLPYLNKDPLDRAYEGVLVSFGLPVESAGSETSQSSQIKDEAEIAEMEEVKDDTPDKPLESALTEDDNPVVAATEAEKKPRERKPARTTTPEEAPEENNLDQAKNAFSQFFNPSNDKGKSAQQSGDPLGEPDAAILEGISRGKGKAGGGLDERGVLYEPEIIEHSQKSGKVVVKVCVDNTGKVISAKYTQKGSTTTDRDLVEIAEISAMKYRFTPSTNFEEQCGSITINFLVQ
jgi:outer membrane biosynthesis protein TonB